MSTDTALRDHLVKLLTTAWAHITAENGIAGVPSDLILAWPNTDIPQLVQIPIVAVESPRIGEKPIPVS